MTQRNAEDFCRSWVQNTNFEGDEHVSSQDSSHASISHPHNQDRVHFRSAPEMDNFSARNYAGQPLLMDREMAKETPFLDIYQPDHRQSSDLHQRSRSRSSQDRYRETYTNEKEAFMERKLSPPGRERRSDLSRRRDSRSPSYGRRAKSPPWRRSKSKTPERYDRDRSPKRRQRSQSSPKRSRDRSSRNDKSRERSPRRDNRPKRERSRERSPRRDHRSKRDRSRERSPRRRKSRERSPKRDHRSRRERSREKRSPQRSRYRSRSRSPDAPSSAPMFRPAEFRSDSEMRTHTSGGPRRYRGDDSDASWDVNQHDAMPGNELAKFAQWANQSAAWHQLPPGNDRRRSRYGSPLSPPRSHRERRRGESPFEVFDARDYVINKKAFGNANSDKKSKASAGSDTATVKEGNKNTATASKPSADSDTATVKGGTQTNPVPTPPKSPKDKSTTQTRDRKPNRRSTSQEPPEKSRRVDEKSKSTRRSRSPTKRKSRFDNDTSNR